MKFGFERPGCARLVSKSTLRKELADERLAPYWTLDRARGSPLETRYSITLVGKGIDTKKPHPQFVFFQYSDARVFRWELAVKFDAWLGDHEKIVALPEAKKITDVMDATFAMRKKHGWDGWLLFTDDAKGMEKTLEDEIAKQSAISEFFETGWRIFRKLEPYLRKLNNAVLRR